jgi:hypothetical protein
MSRANTGIPAVTTPRDPHALDPFKNGDHGLRDDPSCDEGDRHGKVPRASRVSGIKDIDAAAER